MGWLFSFLLELLLMFFRNIIWESAKYIFRRTFLNPSSRLHYKKLMEQLKTFAYAVVILVFIKIYVGLEKIGLIKHSTKDNKILIVLGVTLLLVAIAAAFYYTQNEKERKSSLS